MISTLHFDNARIAQQLFNNNPRNLQMLEVRMSVKATNRDGWIKLDGDEADVARATGLFQSLEGALKAGVAIRNRDFSYALNTRSEEHTSELQSRTNLVCRLLLEKKKKKKQEK